MSLQSLQKTYFKTLLTRLVITILLSLSFIICSQKVEARSSTPIDIDASKIKRIKQIETSQKYKLCSSNEFSTQEATICIFRLAYTMRSEAPCELIKDEYAKSKCIGVVALSSGSYKRCDRYKDDRPNYYSCQHADIRRTNQALDPNRKKVDPTKSGILKALGLSKEEIESQEEKKKLNKREEKKKSKDNKPKEPLKK